MSEQWDGLPENPEKTQIHWIDVGGGEVTIAWNAADQYWSLGMVGFPPSGVTALGWHYLGPCPPPADNTRLTARVATLEAALREIAEASDKPADFKWHDSWGDPVNCDTSNMGDVSDHGFEWGKWSSALIARAALTPEAR